MNPFLSIVIPSFNKSAFIQETLNSLSDQTFKSWEAIVVDDGSSDNSISLIKEKCKKDGRIKIIQRKTLPKGGSACRNIGIANAKSQLIMFLDADDILAPECLSNRFENIKHTPNQKFWVFPIGTFYLKIGDSRSTWIPKGKNFLERFLAHDLPWHTMSVVWERAFLEELDGFDTAYPRLQDVELHTRALLNTKHEFKTFPGLKPDAFYRIDDKRILNTKNTFYYNWVQGVLLYINEIGKLIENEDNSKKLKSKLKGTIFSTFTTLLHRKATAQIDAMTFTELKMQLIYNSNVNRLLTKRDLTFISAYERMYRANFYKIKGFNFLGKKIISS